MNGQGLRGTLAGQTDVALVNVDLRHGSQIGSDLQLEAELFVDLLCLGEQSKRASEVARIPVDLRQRFEIAGFFLPQSLRPHLLERAVQRGDGLAWLAQGRVRRPQLTETAEFPDHKARRLEQPPGLYQPGDRSLGIPDPHVEHAEVVQRDTFPPGVSQGATDGAHLAEPRPSRPEVPQVGVDQADVVGGDGQRHPIAYGPGGAGGLFEMPHGVGQLPSVPGQEPEGVVRARELALQA